MSGKEVKVKLENGDELIDLDISPEEEEKQRREEIERIESKYKSGGNKNRLGVVPDKLVKDLTNDERTLLIKNYTDGVDNDNFNVKQLKNGNISITRKRSGKVKTLDDDVAKKVVNSNGGKVGNMTNEQMMIQNLLEIERKLERERLKRKRLQKKYKKMKSDIYEDNERGMMMMRSLLINLLRKRSKKL